MTVLAEVINIERLYFANLKKVLGVYFALVDIFVNYYDVVARCPFSLLMHAFLSKLRIFQLKEAPPVR